MKRALQRFLMAMSLSLASAVASASIVVSASQNVAGGPVDFAVTSDAPVDIMSIDVRISLPGGVFGPAGNSFAGSDLDFSAWDPGEVVWPAPDELTVTLLGLSNDLVSLAPASFGTGDRIFFFSLPVLAAATGGPYQFGYEVTYFDANFDAVPQDRQTGSFTLADTTPVPEPSTWALMLAGLAGLGTMARRRLA